MGQTTSKQRLRTIKETVRLISQNTRDGKIPLVDKEQYRDLLMMHSAELNLILSKTLKKSTIQRVQALITNALQDLEDLMFFVSNSELDQHDPQYKEKRTKLDRETLNEIRGSIRKVEQRLEVKHLSDNLKQIDYELKRFDTVDSFDKNIGDEKSKLSRELVSIQSALYQMQAEEKLKQIEKKHLELQLDLDNISLRNYLIELIEETNQISPINNEDQQMRKEYILVNINNNLKLLDYKLSEHNLNDIIISFDEFIQMPLDNSSLENLEAIYNRLSNIQVNLDLKVNTLKAYLFNNNDYGKVFFPESISEIDNGLFEERLKIIQKETLSIRDEIFKLDFDKSSHMYIDRKLKLEAYKNELINSQYTNDNQRIMQQFTLQCVDEVYSFLQSNTIRKKDSTNDFLIDITSVNNKIAEIGKRLDNADISLQNCLEMENELMNYERFLQEVNISPARTNICSFRDYVLIQIGNQLSNLYRVKKKLNNSKY